MFDGLFADNEPDAEPQNDYLVTFTVQIIVPAVSKGVARCEALDFVNEMIAKTHYCGDNQNCYTIDSVENLNEDDL